SFSLSSRRRHTRFSRDWSSDVCSSDLVESALVEYSAIFVTSLMLIMVFGVAIPNAWARYGAEAFLAAALPVLLGLRMVLYPLLGSEERRVCELGVWKQEITIILTYASY